MGKLYKDLKEGFEDILAYRKGKITLRSERIVVPDPPMGYKAKDISKEVHQQKMTPRKRAH